MPERPSNVEFVSSEIIYDKGPCIRVSVIEGHILWSQPPLKDIKQSSLAILTLHRYLTLKVAPSGECFSGHVGHLVQVTRITCPMIRQESPAFLPLAFCPFSRLKHWLIVAFFGYVPQGITFDMLLDLLA